MATRGTKKPVAEDQNTAPEAENNAVAPCAEQNNNAVAPCAEQNNNAVAPCAEQNNNAAGGDAPRHYRCIAVCYHGRRLWQVGEETVTTDEMPYHFVEITNMTEGDSA